MQSRRSFLKQLGLGGIVALGGQFPFEAMAERPFAKITILHTNDVHSRLDPFPQTDKNFGGLGGVVRRAELIKRIRKEEKNVLLFDAGDIFQGTPYFNMFQGEPEIKAMNLMKYDACTIGNHEFDLGLENLTKQLEKAKFPVLCANYDFTKTSMKGVCKDYKIFNLEGIKIGVFGLGIQLYGLVAQEAFGRTRYLDALQKGLEISTKLKKEKKCDMVICLSHLGHEYQHEKVSDVVLARDSEYIDIIIGGHTHTFLDTPVVVKNKNQKDVVINQVGWGGVRLGRLDYFFISKKDFYLSKANTVIIGK